MEGSTTWDIYNEIVSKQDDVGKMLQAFVSALGNNDVTAYLTMMAPRLVELRRVLKPTGSIFLHCDPTASHYLKVLMDAVFEPINFRAEIVWKRYGSHNDARRNFASIHDVIFLYSRSREATFNVQYGGHDPEYVERSYRQKDSDGRRWRVQNLSSPNPRPNLTYPYTALNGVTYQPHPNGWKYTEQRMREIDQRGRLVYPKNPQGRLALKTYLDEMKGSPLSDVWTDIRSLSGAHKERLGYPTQKPESLLERIITVGSNDGDIVLDPFCGCGTAVVAAHRLGRNWVGIDITYLAVDLMKNRLMSAFRGDFNNGIEVDGEPADEVAALALAERDKYQFQYWAVAKLGGTARGGENKKGADQGVDGVVGFPDVDPSKSDKSGKSNIDWKQVIVSVKGGATGPAHVRDLIGTVGNQGGAIGVLVIVHPATKAMLDAAAGAGVFTPISGGESYPKIQLITAGDIVHGKGVDMPPRRGLTQYQRAPRGKRGTQGALDV